MTDHHVPPNKDQAFEGWLKRNYLFLILAFLFFFISLSFLAPLLLKIGMNFPARMIYWIDSFFCHQLPFRSWFIYGDQPYYPLASAGLKSVLSFEEYFHPEVMDYWVLRSIIGNSEAGFKLAICQRDIAMYLSLWIFGLIFTLSDRKIKKLPLWIWIMVGVIPLGLDGGMQYLGSLKMPIFHSFARESTPLLRTITGGVFGLLTGWYIFPSLDVMINNEPFVKRKS